MQTFLRYALWFFAGAAALVAVSYLYVVAATRASTYDTLAEAPRAEVVLVLGASVKRDGTLSPVLAARADAAAEAYRAGKVQKILVTGDNSVLSHNEVNPTGAYLMEKGIPKRDIFLDHAGFDTYSSMYRAREVFGVRSMLVASQEFHLPRALFAARTLGIEASGLAVSSEGLFLYNWAREVPATLKTYADLIADRQPKFLGERVDISGDGSSTWADLQGGKADAAAPTGL